MIKIASVIGARPQFVKYSSLARVIAEKNKANTHPLQHILIHSGQHYDYQMSEIFFKELGIEEPDYYLNVGSASHGVQTGLLLQRVEEVFMTEKPSLVVVFGDINTALGAALAAAKLHIPVVHIEAGLRSFNRRMPEEINRVLIDHMSWLLLCPSKIAVQNLQKEGFHHVLYEGNLVTEVLSAQVTLNHSLSEAVVVNSGDLMFDALLFSAQLANQKSHILTTLNLTKKDYYLLTMHRSEYTEEHSKMREMNDFIARATAGKRVIFPIHPRTEKVYQEAHIQLADHIEKIEPVGYFDMLMLLQNSAMLFTDSGGMQKEAYWLNIPCVTMREETEWVETVHSGWNILYKDYQGKHHYNTQTQWLYGDGHAGTTIMNILEKTHSPN